MGLYRYAFGHVSCIARTALSKFDETEDKMKAAMKEEFMPHIMSKMTKDIHDIMDKLDVLESLGQVDELENVVPHQV